MTNRSAGDDTPQPKLRDADALWRSVTSAALADTIFASHARTFREANPVATSTDFAHWVQVAAVRDLGQALPQPANVAQYAAFLIGVVGAVMSAHQSGQIGGFKPSVQWTPTMGDGIRPPSED